MLRVWQDYEMFLTFKAATVEQQDEENMRVGVQAQMNVSGQGTRALLQLA